MQDETYFHNMQEKFLKHIDNTMDLYSILVKFNEEPDQSKLDEISSKVNNLFLHNEIMKTTIANFILARIGKEDEITEIEGEVSDNGVIL
jgi:hypothetical protein